MSPLRLDIRMQPPLLGPFLGLGQAVPDALTWPSAPATSTAFVNRVNRRAGELRGRSQGCSIRVGTHLHWIHMAKDSLGEEMLTRGR
jgi:hypothetical protein